MRRVALVALLAVLVPLMPRAADERLLEALRGNDHAVVKTLLQSGGDPDVRDSSGASALMYATLYASSEEMRLLLDHRADVNATNAAGATALMWAAHDAEKVTILIEHGAAVNARTRTDATPLIVAVRVGNAAAMRILIARGADIKTDNAALIAEAHTQGSPEVEQVLREAGVETREPAQLTAILSAGQGQNMVNVGFTERMLARGAALPKGDIRNRTFSAPLIGYAAATYGLPLARTILEKGADPNRKGTRGITPLMMAASAAEPDPSLVQLLIDQGADIGARDDSGRTALDWALLQGDTAAAQVLRKAGAVALAPPPTPPLPAPAPRTPRAAVEVALARLQPAGPRFLQGGNCISCHHQTLPSIAVALARARGATVDTQLARHPDQATLSLWGPLRDELLLGRASGIAIGGFVGTVAYALLGLAEEKTPSDLLTDALTLDLAAQQRPDGSWNVGDIRPPLFDTSAIHYTALAIRGLDAYMPAGRHVEAMARIARGRQFLEQATARHTQDEAFKLLGLVWSKGSTEEISRQRDRVLELQRADGGWGQRPTMSPDAYQTGQVLYALYASGVPATSGAYQKGVRFLLRSQLQDGTWFMQSRAFAFQPYFETGFPHGTNQFISAAATSWAAIALTYAMF
jgi:ankyrin repeat protein